MKRDSGKSGKRSATDDSANAAAGDAARHVTSAQAAFASYAAPLVGHAVEFAHAVHEDASPEALHKLRVSLRRLRSLWWAFAPLLEKDENTRQRALFKYLATAAGKTRDWDILISLLAQEDSGAHSLSPRLQQARGSALDVSRETLSNADVKHLLRDALADASKELNTAHERVPLRKFATRRVDIAKRSLKKRMKRANRARRSDYAAFHEVRKAGKKLRYLLDFFEPVLKGSCKSTVKRLKRIQKRFGALNDIVASEGLLRDHAASLAGSGDTDAALEWLEKERKRRVRAAAELMRKH
jgi:CHAD domain-containing protein